MRERNRFYTDNIKVLNSIKAIPALWAAMVSGDNIPATAWLNSKTSNFWVWNNSLQPENIKSIFIANPLLVNNLLQVNRDALYFLCSSPIDCRTAQTRSELISRVEGNATLIVAFTDAMKKLATEFEKIIAVGVGANNNPATVDYADIIDVSTVIFDTW